MQGKETRWYWNIKSNFSGEILKRLQLWAKYYFKCYPTTQSCLELEIWRCVAIRLIERTIKWWGAIVRVKVLKQWNIIKCSFSNSSLF